ncbi:MAG TPA: PD-(D/E)XK nuclease family protein [Terriglobales bacterium]|nr:PD-(D/E)XK nuclease family protein [Terriglobales bacterium]
MDFWASLTAGALVLTADAAIARGLRQRYGTRQQAASLIAWETPAIVAWQTWVQENWRGGLVLSREQELLLWEEAIGEAGGLLDRRGTARSAAEAWRRTKAWRLPETGSDWEESDDTSAFHSWTLAFRNRCEKPRWLSAAELPDEVATRLRAGRMTAPKQVWLAGFERMPPQLEALIAALREAGATVATMPLAPEVEKITVCQIANPEQELRRAARWARMRCEEDESTTVVVVVPGLAQQRAKVERIFANELEPNREPWSPAPSAVYVSGGDALAKVPVTAAALTVLRLVIDGYERLDTRLAIQLLRSPYTAGADKERAPRAREEKELRRREFAGRDFWNRAGRRDLRRERASWPEKQSYGAWSEAFDRALAAIGWPGDRALSIAEQAAVNLWQDVQAALARLDQVADQSPALDRAWRRLLAMMEERTVPARPESARVVVMDWHENSGSEFDHVWIAGMEEDALTPARPHPFLPLRWHREESTAAEIWARWHRGARTLVASFTERPNPLLSVTPPAVRNEDAAASTVVPTLEAYEDAPVPLLSGGKIAGGSRFFEDQSACPFRAFVHHRLHAHELAEVPSGLDAIARGSLLHKMLERFYREMPSQEMLISLSEAVLAERVRACATAVVDEAGLRERPQLALVEEQRLERLTLDWLEKEKDRHPWTAIGWEEEREAALGGLRFKIKIDRVDRLPESGNGLLLIDYKSGEQARSGWDGERPLQPQLPLYLLTTPESSTIEGIALAQLKPGAMAFKPALRGGAGFKIDEWRSALLALAREIEAGEAEVRPKLPRQTICERCDLPALCRISERDPRLRAEAASQEALDAE